MKQPVSELFGKWKYHAIHVHFNELVLKSSLKENKIILNFIIKYFTTMLSSCISIRNWCNGILIMSGLGKHENTIHRDPQYFTNISHSNTTSWHWSFLFQLNHTTIIRLAGKDLKYGRCERPMSFWLTTTSNKN